MRGVATIWSSILILTALFMMPLHAQTSPVPDAFRNIIRTQELPGAYRYAARPDYSQPSLSPQGTRLAMVARLADSVTTLVVLDISGNSVKPLTRLEVPEMKSIQNYGWASEDRLVVWVNMDTSNSADEDPSPSLYIAQLDLSSRNVTERTQPTRMAMDVESPYPLSSDLVRAPWREPDHVLISECSRKGGMKYKQRGEAASYTFASTQSLPSSTIACQLLDWDLTKNRASALTKPFYAFPTRFFANTAGDNLFAEGRKTGGKMTYATMTPSENSWNHHSNSDPAQLQPIWDSSELDFADSWKTIHRILDDRLDPSGSVIKTSHSGQPIGIQFSSPEIRFTPLDAGLISPTQTFNNTFANLEAYRGASIRWLGSTDDKRTVLFSVENNTNPGTYFVWRQADNVILHITNSRNLNREDLASTYLEPGWLPAYVPVAVTLARHSAQPKGYVLMPLVMDDAVAAEQLYSVDLTAEWFAANGLMVVRVPVGLPAALPAAQQGSTWRTQVALRLTQVAEQLQKEYKLASADSTCVYGRDINAYAALAARAFGSPVACVIAMNPRLEPTLFTQPYTLINTTAKSWYLSSDNVELRMWRSLYGDDMAAGTPANWVFPANSNIMLGFDMFDEHRALSTYTGGLQQAVNKANGQIMLYTPNLDASKTDQWLSNSYDAMIKFVLPPNIDKVGKVYVGDIQDTESSTPAGKK